MAGLHEDDTAADVRSRLVRALKNGIEFNSSLIAVTKRDMKAERLRRKAKPMRE
jgi:hypothetical protein